jgi:hypothetical protein
VGKKKTKKSIKPKNSCCGEGERTGSCLEAEEHIWRRQKLKNKRSTYSDLSKCTRALTCQDFFVFFLPTVYAHSAEVSDDTLKEVNEAVKVY